MNNCVKHLLLPCPVQKFALIVRHVKYQIAGLQVVRFVQMDTDISQVHPPVVESVEQVSMHKERRPMVGAKCVQMDKSIILILKKESQNKDCILIKFNAK